MVCASIPSAKVWKFSLFYYIFCFQIILPSRSGVHRELADIRKLSTLYKNPFRVSCSSSRPYLQNEDPTNFASFGA